MKMKKVLENQGLFLAEKERFEFSELCKTTYGILRYFIEFSLLNKAFLQSV